MSKTKGFMVDFKLPDGKVITKHLHKLDDMKSMVDKFKIPAVTIHGPEDKIVPLSSKELSDLNKWPVIPELAENGICEICNPKKENK